MPQSTSDILLVEDDPGQARLVTKTLARAGYDISHVPDAASCLERVRQQPPSLLLLDRGLPDCSGLELLRTLRAEFPQVCVIMLTGTDDAAVAVDAMRIGAADYVVKRPDLSHLTDLPLVLARNRERLRLLRDREALNQAVRASEERYRELFNNASDAIFVCDSAGLLQQVNQAFLDLVGCTRDEVQGRQLNDLLASTSPVRTPKLRELSLCGERQPTAELHLLSKNGRSTVLEVATRPIREHGAMSGFQGIGRDVTEQRQIEQMKADFLAMITHDMKNPVAIIVGYTEIMLNDGDLGSDWREMLASIDSSARGLLHLIMNFLDLSKIEAGALRLQQAETDINEVLRQVIQEQGPMARAKKIEVIENFEPVPLVEVDRTQMDRVFINLVGNAIKFTPREGRVQVKTSCPNGMLEVSISDTGPGIPEEQLPQLFRKYQRLSSAGQTDGTGLGLFIAKSMVEAHGGRVRVESCPNAGATFIVSLPVARG
jgi:two-component system phosphate regulon sensor histidine kinase PhoR